MKSPWKALLLVAAGLPSGHAVSLATTGAAVSEITVTSTMAEAVTNTYSSTVPVMTTVTSCTPASYAVAMNSCHGTVWSANNAYWRELCAASLTGGSSGFTRAGDPATASIYFEFTGCTAVEINSHSNEYYLFSGEYTIFSHSSDWVLERYTTDPCVVTEAASILTDTWYATSTIESTITYTSTISLAESSTAVPSTSKFQRCAIILCGTSFFLVICSQSIATSLIGRVLPVVVESTTTAIVTPFIQLFHPEKLNAATPVVSINSCILKSLPDWILIRVIHSLLLFPGVTHRP
ncbi:uncharacterized protein BO80DRAFT_438657 [Aspergillus ibericus CBS 121593]|uniref:Uncharacterized protein n=1 Tax=Aspergillus ibericus CBS 121593 TaxID=1448316 RepID=A0A395GLA2_9EURO|nr:hypothetical protein BO80DRAFT_438657 [Aspergillus ibericus CBS 121593]RAK96291.1 hypothetical protein BO80DRAFT_438657 [Aspergillus ibericus CBS 121593]